MVNLDKEYVEGKVIELFCFKNVSVEGISKALKMSCKTVNEIINETMHVWETEEFDPDPKKPGSGRKSRISADDRNVMMKIRSKKIPYKQIAKGFGISKSTAELIVSQERKKRNL